MCGTHHSHIFFGWSPYELKKIILSLNARSWYIIINIISNEYANLFKKKKKKKCGIPLSIMHIRRYNNVAIIVIILS